MATARSRRPSLATFGWLALVLVVAACGSVGSVAPSSMPSPPPTGPSPAVSPGLSPSAGPSGQPSTDDSSPPIPWDDALLAILPATVDGLPVTEDRETAAQIGADPALAAVADGLVYTMVVDPSADEFALASVVRFEPGVLDEVFFRAWRDSFDEGACSQAGGVSGNAEAEIGGRTTFIGTCAGGLRTYHVALPDHGIVVSVSALGERRLGEQFVEGLAEPA